MLLHLAELCQGGLLFTSTKSCCIDIPWLIAWHLKGQYSLFQSHNWNSKDFFVTANNTLSSDTPSLKLIDPFEIIHQYLCASVSRKCQGKGKMCLFTYLFLCCYSIFWIVLSSITHSDWHFTHFHYTQVWTAEQVLFIYTVKKIGDKKNRMRKWFEHGGMECKCCLLMTMNLKCF